MPKTILIIDDSASIRQIVSVTLIKAGYDVIEATDGMDAISKLKGQKIHLIVCDLNMPNMDGFSFVKHAKQLPEYKFTPVLMLTTESQIHRKLEGKTAGVRAWIVKPFKPEQLAATIEKMILP